MQIYAKRNTNVIIATLRSTIQSQMPREGYGFLSKLQAKYKGYAMDFGAKCNAKSKGNAKDS